MCNNTAYCGDSGYVYGLAFVGRANLCLRIKHQCYAFGYEMPGLDMGSVTENVDKDDFATFGVVKLRPVYTNDLHPSWLGDTVSHGNA